MSGSLAARALASTPRLAGRAGGVLLAYVLVGEVALGRGLPELAANPLGIALGLFTSALVLASSIAHARAPGPVIARAARSLAAGGAGLLLLGLPASVLWRATETLWIAEGQRIDPEVLPGLPGLTAGRIRVAPVGDEVLLSKTVSLALRTDDGQDVEIGLWPPALLAGWRLTILRFGYAPELTWRDEGAVLADGVALIGTFPRSDPAAALVQWTPPPNVMMGVGYYPPPLEDLLTPPRSRRHLFLRLEEATLAGVRRDLRDPDAERWLADGRPLHPVWFAQVFRKQEKLWEGRVAAGGEARFGGGALRIGPELTLWVEVQAVRDAWLWVALAGTIALAAGAIVAAFHRAVSRGPAAAAAGHRRK